METIKNLLYGFASTAILHIADIKIVLVILAIHQTRQATLQEIVLEKEVTWKNHKITSYTLQLATKVIMLSHHQERQALCSRINPQTKMVNSCPQV